MHRNGSGAELPPNGTGAERSENRGIPKDYLRTDLTDAEQTALSGSIVSHHEATKTLQDSLKAGTITQTEFDTQAKALRTAHVEAMLPYVIETKRAEFKTKMESMPAGNAKSAGSKKDKTAASSESKTAAATKKTAAKATLPASVGTAIDNRLSAYSSDDEKVEWLNAVLTKVETLESKTKKAKTKALLTELKELLNTKIESLADEVESDDSISDIFE